jgi:hypothetical protein
MTKYTTKQMGDACEMLVAAELTLAGMPAMKAPEYWPGYDVVVQPLDTKPQRISVKSRTFKRGAAFVRYSDSDVFDWLAIVILPADGCARRRIFVVPRRVADEQARIYAAEKMKGIREYRIDEVANKFAAYEDNFCLNDAGCPLALGRTADRSALITPPRPDPARPDSPG